MKFRRKKQSLIRTIREDRFLCYNNRALSSESTLKISDFFRRFQKALIYIKNYHKKIAKNLKIRYSGEVKS